jgi:HAD superfamily hydrolase (TIGR01450 family)
MGHAFGVGLGGCDKPLCDRYDTAMFDLDGVVYVGPHPVEGAPEHITAVQQAGMHIAFVTNNASRTPVEVVQHLRELGIPAGIGDVVTSAQAAARLVAGLVPEGSAVLVVGGDGLVEALAEHHLHAVRTVSDDTRAVVQGFSREVGWPALAEAVFAVRAGLPWVASNLDATLPTPRGLAPGNGQLVDLVARTTGARPTAVAGKPERALFDETVLRVGGERPLVIGDRLDTDIAGAARAGLDSLLVLTGVTDVATLAMAPRGQRPTYVANALAGLLVAHPQVTESAGEVRCAGWVARCSSDGTSVEVAGHGATDDALRALVSACWHVRDGSGRSVDPAAVRRAWRSAEASASGATVGSHRVGDRQEGVQ